MWRRQRCHDDDDYDADGDDEDGDVIMMIRIHFGPSSDPFHVIVLDYGHGIQAFPMIH